LCSQALPSCHTVARSHLCPPHSWHCASLWLTVSGSPTSILVQVWCVHSLLHSLPLLRGSTIMHSSRRTSSSPVGSFSFLSRSNSTLARCLCTSWRTGVCVTSPTLGTLANQRLLARVCRYPFEPDYDLSLSLELFRPALLNKIDFTACRGRMRTSVHTCWSCILLKYGATQSLSGAPLALTWVVLYPPIFISKIPLLSDGVLFASAE
jgi:hypothetical protein